MRTEGRPWTRRGVLAAAPALAACQPLAAPPPLRPGPDFAGARLEPDSFVAADGARLPLRVWPATGGGEPVDVVIGLHGFDDYSAAFTLPAPYWAARGVTTYAYDQRGFGAAPGRGVWAGARPMAHDLGTLAALLRARHPRARLSVVGESMGGAVAIVAAASITPPAVDRVVLASPAVWGWRVQGPVNGSALWLGAHLAPAYRLSPPGWLARRIWASDNIAELRRMSRDPLMIGPTRLDTIYGLVDLMQQAAEEVGTVAAATLYQYGAHDEIIPPGAAEAAVRRLRPDQRSAYYPQGWHLLLRDVHRQAVLDDIVAFLRDADAALPSGAAPVPTHRPGRQDAPA